MAVAVKPPATAGLLNILDMLPVKRVLSKKAILQPTLISILSSKYPDNSVSPIAKRPKIIGSTIKASASDEILTFNSRFILP